MQIDAEGAFENHDDKNEAAPTSQLGRVWSAHQHAAIIIDIACRCHNSPRRAERAARLFVWRVHKEANLAASQSGFWRVCLCSSW